MKKATNINEFANNLIPENFLKPEDKDVYVPIYEELLKVLRDMVIKDQVESQAFFVAGQAGTGKTTALNFFTNETLKKQYFIKYINMRDLINELLEVYIEKITGGKNLLVIIDDLDKMRKIEQINSIFIENRNYIFSLKCKKIISIPTYLTKVPEISNYSQYPICQFVLRLKPNPFNGEPAKKEEEKIEANRQMLRKVIKCRVQEGVTLIDDDALEEAIEKSGGIIRQLIRIVRVAAVKVRTLGGAKISADDIKEAIDLLRNNMAGTIISTNKINMLYTVLSENVPVSETSIEFIELLQANNVVAYENGEPWYEVNPIISNTVKVYAQKQQKR